MGEEKTELQSNKDLSVFRINELMVSTYNKIAKWHNDDASGAALKLLSIELIEDIAGAAFSHLGVPYNNDTKIHMDEETKKKIEAEKEKLGSDTISSS
jgi:hypothetical protein